VLGLFGTELQCTVSQIHLSHKKMVRWRGHFKKLSF